MIPFFRPSVTNADCQAVADTMRTGWLTSGPMVLEFERRVAEYLGCEHAIAVSSGTMALQLALEAVKKPEKDEVITTPLTFCATAEAILRAGLKPVFVDTLSDSPRISPQRAIDAYWRNTLAIVPVGIGGKSVGELPSLPITVIADAAHEFGGRVPPGEAACYSFHANKNLTTNGEGGLVATNDEELADFVRRQRTHGLSNTAWARREDGNPYAYDVKEAGWKGNMPDTAAAMGLSQLTRFEDMQRKRRYLCWAYQKMINGMDEDIRPTPVMQGMEIEECSCHLYQVMLPEWMDRDRVFKNMQDHNVCCGVHYIPLYHMTAWRDDPARFPNCERVWKRLLSLPLFPDMTYTQWEFVSMNFQAALKEEAKQCGRLSVSVS